MVTTTSLNLLFTLSEAEFITKSQSLAQILRTYLVEWGYVASPVTAYSRYPQLDEYQYGFTASSPTNKPLLKILEAFIREYEMIRLELQEDGKIKVWGVVV